MAARRRNAKSSGSPDAAQPARHPPQSEAPHARQQGREHPAPPPPPQEDPLREPDEIAQEVEREFLEAQQRNTGGDALARRIARHTSSSPDLTAGDVDADWEREDVGEEGVGGSVATPDQDIVEAIGEAVGIRYEDDEPIGTVEKLEGRDRRRWEMNPVSSEDYQDRKERQQEDVDEIEESRGDEDGDEDGGDRG